MLSFVAERERENIKQRQMEGISVAKAKGKHLGKPQMNIDTLSKEQKMILDSNYPKWQSKEITAVQFINMLRLKKNTFYKIVKEYQEQA